MSQPIFNIIKPKNYEFNDRYRRAQLAPATTHPLRGTVNNVLKVKNKGGDFDDDTTTASDPLQSTSPSRSSKSNKALFDDDESDVFDPLSSSSAQIKPTKKSTQPRSNISDPFANTLAEDEPLKKSPTREVSDITTKKEETKGDDEDEKEFEGADEKIVVEEMKTAANTNVWKDDMRGALLRIFNPKKLEHLKIRNPFKAEKMHHERNVVYVKSGRENNTYSQDTTTVEKSVPGLRTYVTYSYYIKSIEAIKRDILKAWKKEDKVLALQLAIQGVKLLMDTEEPNFYPAKYTFVIDLLEVFSMLVFERIKKLSFPKLSDERLKEIRESNIEDTTINEAAKDICRNWFLKISVIRELMPRIYIQGALIRNMVFLSKDKIKSSLMRLLRTCRGLTDPLIASYAQVYILRLAIELMPKEKIFLKVAFNDFLLNMREGGRFQHKSLSFDEYMNLFEPYLEIIFRFYSQNSTEEDFREMFKIYEQSSQHAEILKKFIKYFSPQMISDNMLEINGFIEVHSVKNRLELYALLCDVMNKSLPSPNVIGILFQKFLRDIYEIKEFVPFLNFIAVLLDLISKNYDSTTRNQFLISILKRFAEFFTTIDWSNEGKDKEVFEKLQEFLEKIIDTCENISEILALEPFLQFVTYLPSTMKKSVCKKFLSRFAESDQKINDAILVHTLLSIARPLNDDYGFSMADNEKEEVARMVRKMVLNVSFGKDVEQMLNFYTEVRAFFGNLPGILELLIEQGLDISMKCRKFAKGKITKQVFSFIQASISFCFISISSIEEKVVQFDYYLKTAQIALLFNLASQAETLCKSAIGLFTELPKKYKDVAIEDVMESKIKSFISYLIIIPENPENDYLHIFNGLYTGLTQYFKWSKRRGLFIRTRIFCDCLSYICVQLQEKLPYHVENVKSNDALYPEEEYKTALFEKFQVIIEDITKNMAEINQLEITEVEPAIAVAKINLAVVNCYITYILPCPLLLNTVKTCLDVLKKNNRYLKASALKDTKFTNVKGFITESFKNIKKNVKDTATVKAVDDIAAEYGISLN